MKQDPRSRQIHGSPAPPPHVGTQRGEPQDGRHHIDVVEEQRYADSRPTPDAREPHVGDRPVPQDTERKP